MEKLSKKNKKKDINSQDTLAYIFRMNEKEVFTNELQNLMEEIDNSSIQICKIPIIINFIHYKLCELENHKKIAESLLNNPDTVTNIIFKKFCKKESLTLIKNFILDALIIKIFEMEGVSIDMFKSFLIPEDSKIKNSNMRLYKLIENKYQELIIKNNTENNVNLNISNRNSNEYGKKYGNIQYNNIYNISNKKSAEIKTLSNFANLKYDNLLGQEEQLEPKFYKEDYNNSDVIFNNDLKNNKCYKLKIYYLDGADSYFQLVNIKSKSSLDYNSFIYSLKKKLGIYENAKFLIVLMENKKEKEFLENLAQLKLGEINELKIVPIQYKLSDSLYY